MGRYTPCRGCQDRRVGCHAECERYLVFRQRVDKEAEIRRQSIIFGDYKSENIYKKRYSLKHTEGGRRALRQR